MQLTESEYYLLSELITMPNRVLAQKIELLIWPTGPQPDDEMLEAFVRAMEQSDCASVFESLAAEIVDTSGATFDTSERVVMLVRR